MTRLFTRTIGEQGPRIAFCHGLFGQGRNWNQIAKGLADDFRVSLVDLPDHGKSPWSESFSYVGMADTLAAELGELAPGEKWTLVGHSMGGKVAMLVALRHPDLLERLGVVDISPVSYGGLRAFGKYVMGMRSIDLESISSRSEAEASLQERVPDATVRGFLLQNLRRDDGGFAWQMNLTLLGDSLSKLGDWPADAISTGTTYGGPVLWVAGAESAYVTTEYDDAMRRLFPRAQLITIKRAGHWVHSEQPEVFLAVLRRYLTADT
ncbi:alpha/beta fold hydrolase [Demetria terragena]|uniref:alpha/beta fold hydrolase n=1 Tax=Demetria terragena TaxID=63959 RepID=UPI00036A3488|nr:alpha/beta fold hydrolase [Demetria terragena]